MIRFLNLLLVLQCCAISFAQNDNLFAELDELIVTEHVHNLQKEQKLDSLKNVVAQYQTKGKEWEQYQLYQQIASEYSTFVFDSAMHYYRGAIAMAYEMDHKEAIAYSQSKFGHLLVSVGFYKEAIDTLHKVNVDDLSGELVQNHFSYLVRAYYDLADYIKDDYYAPAYRLQADAYVDSVLKYRVEGTVQPVITEALRYLVEWSPDSAAFLYGYAEKELSLTLHEQAVVHSCLGFIDITNGDNVRGKEHLIKSAIADIKTSTKEAMSLMVLARFLFEQGDVQRAYNYILKAQRDANYFGSRQRKLQVAEIFPVIEGAKLLLEERKKEEAIKYIWIISGLVLLVLFFLVVVYRQLFNLRKIWVAIKKNNKELVVLNGKLKEANKIKEKYIGHFFNTSSMFIHKLDSISKSVNNLLVSNNPNKLKTVLKEINPKKERDQLFHNFDEVFLSIFPTFISEVEALNQPEEKYVLKSGQLLNTELRILALIRLGIEDNETMAQVLGVSINTIYTYKTKAKNRSLLSTEEFFNRLNNIKSN
ncbi:hypothetical protein E9993_17520 [Labilibacter sediminis]|nr:hypothetical protein E9993_17520 [Labilibacter sediminis]